jgi:predicted transcriptional regulator
MSADPSRLIEELTADLEPGDAAELAAELARMIDLGLLELDEDEGRVGIAAPRAA